MDDEAPLLVRLGRQWRLVLEVIATLLVIAVAVQLMVAVGRTGSRPEPSRGGNEARPAKLPDQPLSLENAAAEGAKTAKVALIEYSDYQCPDCGRFARETEPGLRKEYVESGRVLFAFRHLPLSIHQYAVRAAETTECARRQGKFWQLHDLLFANQQQLDDVSLRLRATAAKLDLNEFDACFAGAALEQVKRDQMEATRLGITSTPTFLVGVVQPDGRVKARARFSGALPVDQFTKAIDQLLAEVGHDSK